MNWMTLLQSLLPSIAGAGATGATGVGAAGGMLAGATGAGAAAAPAGMLASAAPAAAAPAAAATQAAPGGILGRFISPSTGSQLMDMGAAMMRANGPSLDPSAGSLMSGLGAGAEAFSASRRASQDDAVKSAYTQAMTSNAQASADSTQAAIAREAENNALRQQFFSGGQAQVSAPSTALGTGLQAGHEEGGFVYVGGDPANPASWQRIGG